MCETLAVSRSGFYAWQARPPSERQQRHQQLLNEMREIHEDHDTACYGSPRMTRELAARGQACSENTVAKLMREHQMAASFRRKFRMTTDSNHNHPIAENVLDREFVQDVPNRVWLSDITYIWTCEGWLYLACVLDTFSRKIVGWSMSGRMTQDLVLAALGMALTRRRPERSDDLLHHSDRGSQYASGAYQQLLEEEGITCSMSRKGNCWDNAMMESFFASLKKERIQKDVYYTREEARASVFHYIEVFYNRVRLHSELGYLSPEQYEAEHGG